ncbi:hypothetical protein AGMMS49974_01630 [Deltaproteobacteria bacterium]|nr:hypothetical protein AGMMS49925_08890 [Deltaproteobacteria bacterium]GHU93625.1 hypothetical protein AGMMS49974_01630 [Deltaproteobacteria bacterium]
MRPPLSTLQIRLKNCIQTILELETDLSAEFLGSHFNNELTALKNYLQQVDNMMLAEDDVKRLEDATANFLAEIRLSNKGLPQQKRLLQ